MRWRRENFTGHREVRRLLRQAISLNQVELSGFHELLILGKIIHLL